jgi:hypothetical protein
MYLIHRNLLPFKYLSYLSLFVTNTICDLCSQRLATDRRNQITGSLQDHGEMVTPYGLVSCGNFLVLWKPWVLPEIANDRPQNKFPFDRHAFPNPIVTGFELYQGTASRAHRLELVPFLPTLQWSSKC